MTRQNLPLLGQSLLVVATTVPIADGDGIPPFVSDLAQEMAALGARVCILAPAIQGSTAPSSLRDGVQVVRFRYLPSRFETLGSTAIVPALRRSPLLVLEAVALVVGMFFSLAREVLLRKPDWVHAHWTLPTGLLVILSRIVFRQRFKILVSSHGADVFALNGFTWQMLRRWVVRTSDLVLPTSRELALRLGIHPKFAVPMGADSNVFRPVDATQRGRRYLFVGRLEEKKGLATLIEAISRVPGATLDVVGSGPLEGKIARMLADLNLCNRVELKGPCSKRKIAELLQSSRALVVPSIRAGDGDTESGPVVALEAVLSQCPIIATDVGEVPGYWLKDGVTARITEAGSVAELVKAICDFERSPSLRQEVARRAYIELSDAASMVATANRYATEIIRVTSGCQ